jgi:NADH:ubiquinone oxidoreductase subunit 6 (subunit J)
MELNNNAYKIIEVSNQSMCLDLKIWKSRTDLVFFLTLAAVTSIVINITPILLGQEPNIILQSNINLDFISSFLVISLLVLIALIAVYELEENNTMLTGLHTYLYITALVLPYLFAIHQLEAIQEAVNSETITTNGKIAALISIILAILSALLVVTSICENRKSSKQFRQLNESYNEVKYVCKNIRDKFAYFYRDTGDMRCKFCVNGNCKFIENFKCGGFWSDIKICPQWSKLHQLTAEPDPDENK